MAIPGLLARARRLTSRISRLARRHGSLAAVEEPRRDATIAPSRIKLHGWATSRSGRVTGAVVVVPGWTSYPGTVGISRPDIEALHPSVPAAGSSGWEARADLRGFSRRKARFDLWLEDASGRWRRALSWKHAVRHRIPFDLPSGQLDPPQQPTAGGPQFIRGWALFPDGPASSVDVLHDGSLTRARVGMPSPDIALRTTVSGAAICRFEAVLDPQPGVAQVRARSATGHDIDLGEVALRPRAASAQEPLELPVKARHQGGLAVVLYTHALDLSGAPLFLVGLVRELRRRGYPCRVVSQDFGVLAGEIGWSAVRIAEFPRTERAYLGWVGDEARSLHDAGAAVVVANSLPTFPAVDAAQAAGLPVAMIVHEAEPAPVFADRYYDFPRLDPAVRSRFLSAPAAADATVFVSERTRKEARVDAGRAAIVLPVGVSVPAMVPDRARARGQLGLDPTARVVLSVGTVEPRKGQAVLAEAFRPIAEKLADARLVFLGDRGGAGSVALQEYIIRAGLNDQVRLLGVDADPSGWYAAADLFVCASDAESGPLTVFEAMAHGVPVVSTTVGDLPSLLEEGRTAYLCEPGDVASLRDALGRALSASPAERAEMGRAGRDLVRERRDQREAMARYADLISELAAR